MPGPLPGARPGSPRPDALGSRGVLAGRAMVAVSVMREADESAGQNRKSNHGVILPECPCPDCGFRRIDEFIRPGGFGTRGRRPTARSAR